ncbi:MAG: hypothetical protein NTY77_04250 [Elusimicrobia bacterium]|nr:hypothetical protein [Elusimicrobiota bacterium]
MKNTLALACLAVLACPLWAAAAEAAPGLPSDDAALYAIMSHDRSVEIAYKEHLKQWGEYSPENAAQWHAYLDGYRNLAKRSVALKPGQTVTDIQKACNNGHLLDGSPCQDSTAPVVPEKKPKPGEKKTATTGASAGANINTDNTAKANVTAAGVVPHGETPVKAEEKADPNKWNDTIAGGKMAIWAALIGFCFGGPIGMMTFAMVGFGAGYFIHKMS